MDIQEKKQTDKDYIEELAKKIKKYQKSYYENEAEISDAEFDSLWDELKSLSPNHPVLQEIGSDVDLSQNQIDTKDGFQKAKHLIPMGSQEKAANPEQFLDWAKKHKYPEYLVEYKLDGASLELQYEKGIFTKAVTRGNGEIGDDITQNALKMKGIVKNLENQYTGGVRGEVIMTRDVHKNHFSDKANCRNAANGLMKRKDGSGSEHLTIICYDVFFTNTDFVDSKSSLKSPFTTEKEKIQWLKKSGFNTVELEICKNPEEVIEYRAKVMELRPSLNYDIDGLVIKNNQIDTEDAFKNRPDKQIAFKFSLEEAISTVRKVIWNENGATYTPIAEFDTVELAGTKVSRASLANPNTIKELGLFIGSKVVVTKRGEIIPKIEYVLKDEHKEQNQFKKEDTLFANFVNDENLDLEPVKIPEICGTCGSKLQNDGTRLFCPNPKCSKRALHQIEKWVSVLDIRDFGSTLIKNLFDAKDIQSISDIYKLTEETLTKHFLNEESIEKDKVSLGAKKVLQAIEKSRNVSLAKFIAGFDIEGIGENMVEKLIEAGFSSLDSLLNASETDFENVYMFAKITAKTLFNGLKDNKEEMENLVKNQIITIESAEIENPKLAGLSFCFTGELYTMKRAEAEKKVKALGGTTKSSVVKGLSYLVTNDTTSGSAKNVKAQSLGIPVINEEEFLKML